MAVNCIVPNKKQAESLGITEGQLKNILQEYTNSPELQSQFTEEEFIDSKLNGLPVIGVSDAQMQAWDEVYFTPREFDSIEDYNEAASTAEAIFGREAIGHRETPEGKHILSVANPYTESMVKERLEIKEKAIADGTFMKAPNGNPTNLSERQWLQVRTREFKDWFGDWENDAENASKAVDENGEPRVFYHRTGSDFSIFDLRYFGQTDYGDRGVGFYFGYDTERYAMYGNIVMPVFLNIRNPFNGSDHYAAYINRGVPKEKVISDAKESIYSNAEQEVSWMIEQRDSGGATSSLFDRYFTKNSTDEDIRTTIFSEAERAFKEISNKLGNLDSTDGYLTGTYEATVIDPNQIKSADKNIGGFSREEDNIYYNKSSIERSILDNLADNPSGFSYFERVGDKVKLKGNRAEAIKALQLYIESRQLPSDYIGVTKEGYLYEKTRKYPLQDQIEAYKESEDLFENSEQQEQAMQVLEFLKEKTGLNFEFISEDRAKELLDGKSIDGVNAFVKEDTAYFIKGGNRKFNTDIVSEEMLHPFVASIRKENAEAFESLRKDARKAFPVLAKQIESTYKTDVQEEIVTQALARTFRKDYEENPNHNAIKELITKFWDYVKSWFRSFIDDLPVFSESDRAYLYAQDLSESITIENLAKLINSELLLGDADRISRTALNQDINSQIQKHQGNWSRQEAENNPRTLYVFTDNTDRDSGSGVIAADSWYSKKYGEGHHFPTMTAAVVRGLDNSRPISTQKWYHNGAKGVNGRWTDADVEEFRRVIKEELEEIVREFNTGKYDTIMFPSGDGLFNTSISNITKERTPQLYQALADLLHEYGFDKLIPSNVTAQTTQQPILIGPETKINIYAGTNENADLSNMAERPFVYNGIQFNSVEQAFQYIKGDYAEYNGYKSADGTRLAASNQAIILRSTPWDARRLGRRYTMDEASRKNWDAHSSEVMKDLIKESFIQNPQALQRLLDTGDAVFTHTQEREDSKWREEFPKLLMEVRNELRNEQNVGSAQETASIITNIRPENRAVYQRGIARQRGISSLYDNSVGLTTTEVQYEARQLSYWISDNVTDIQNNPELLYDKFGVAKTNDWATEGDKQKDIKAVSNMSRRQIISKVTLNKFRDVYKNDIFVDNPAIDDLTGRDAEKLPVLIDNIDTLFDLGLSTFKQSEGFSITYDSQLNVEQIVDSDGTETFIDDDVVDLAQLAEEGVKLEDWMIDKEAMDILGTATAQVKAALSQAFEVDSEGRDTLDYLGRKVRLSQDDAVKSIIRWTQGSQDINDMIAKLDEKANTHPWLIQIVERLEDTTGETDFISQFYSTFQKHFVLFDIIKKNNKGNRYYFMDVNNRPALNQAMNEIMVNFQLNLSPMFTSTGYNQHNLEIFKSIVAGLKAPAAYNATEEQFNAKKDNFARVISSAARLLGYEISPEKVSQSIDYSNIKSVTDSLDKILTTFESHPNTDGTYNPFKYSRGKDTGSIRGYLKDFLSTITESVEDTTESSFYEAGKMRQSYQVPAYITKLFGKLQGDSELFNSTLQNEFMPFEWFYQNGEWRNSLLGDLADKSPEERRELLVYKRNLKFGKDQYMRGMSQERYGLSVLTEFASPRFVNGMPVSFYRLPIQSNKASSDFVSFYRYTGRFYKDNILSNLLLTFGQELSRIQTVEMRNRKKGDTDYIENFDGKRGRQFCFLDFLNDPKALVNDSFTSEAADKFKSLIDAKVKGEEVDNVALNELAKRAIESGLNNVFANTYEHFRSLGMLDAIKNIEGVLDEDSKIPADIQVQRFIENFVWNDTLASINITQLLVTDLAFYKNSDDFQKRFAQVHSPGVRGNEFAVDYDGKRVSDGKIRMVFLNDFESFKANMIENLEVILDRNIEQASTGTAKNILRALKGNILSSMRKINVTDGQALISPTFARKVGYMYGKWSQELEQAYGRVTKGNYSLNDRTALTNVRKPFIYSQLLQSVNTNGTPLSSLKVGTQIKDSEYMLVLAGALLRNAETGRPNFLKILYDVMEDSAYNNGVNYNGKGIDIFAFNSAVKTGLTGSSDASTKWANGDYSKESTQKAEAELKNYLLSQIYLTDENGTVTNSYNQFAVKEIPVEDYATQVENPFHTLDERVIWGSQMRAILESNLNYVDSAGNPVIFTWTDNNGQEHNVGRDDFKKAYEENAAAIIDTFIDKTKDEFGLGDKNVSFEDSRIAIANALQEEILKNIDRYGPDMLLACSIDENGKFKLPPGDPTQGKRIAQLVNSIIKNRLNKPKVAGGMAVQVSSFGMSDQLHIRFFAKDGKTLLPTKEEWLKDHPNGDYKKFCEENQGGIAYEENYAPAHMGEFFRYFTDSNGNVDVEAIEMLDENLLLSIDERTPTEFYYSISVAKIKDFLPKEAGDGFMRPYEITEIDDSDFDNDKQSKWKLSAQIVRNKEKFGVKELIDAVPELQAMDKGDAKNIAKKFLDRETDKFQKSYTVSENPNLFRAMKEAYIKANFSVQYPTEGENALLNNSWRMSLAVLQSESNAAKLLSPGGNADLARQGYLAEAVSVTGRSYDELDALDTDSIKDIISSADKNVMLFINQMEYYKRNNDASSNLGIFAVAATSHNLLEGQGYAIANSEEFTIAGKHFDEIVELDPMYDTDGMLVSKSLGSNVSGAADAAKVPSHGYLNINGNTINEYLVLLRTGMPQYKAVQLFATKPLKSLVSELTSANVERVTTNIKTLLNNRLNTIITEMNLPKDSSLYREELSWDEIKQSLSNPTPEMEFKILLAFQRLGNLTEGMRAFTFVTRYNSIASAVGPLITDNIWHEHQLDTYNDYKGLKKIGFRFLDASDNNAEKTFGDTVTNRLGNTVVVTPYNHADLELQGVITPSFSFNDVTLEDVKNEHPMLKSFSMGYDLAREMFDRLEMPLISSTFRGVINLPEYQGFFFSNKDGLNKFSDFYLSYLLVQSGIIKSDASLKNDGPQYYIRKFPQEFLSKRNSYKGNALVDMIHPRIDEDVVSLELKTSGMKVDTKTELQSAWLELYKKDAGFALDLFKYNFWKGGLGFSPKTFMNLIPIQIKEQINGYTQTFTKNGPSVSGEIVLDQFFRNNAKDNNIVRFISDFGRGNNRYDQKTKELVFGESWYDDLKKSPFIKFKDGSGKIRLFKINTMDSETQTLTYIETTGLGNNGEFIEISNKPISKSFVDSEIADAEDTNDSPIEPSEIPADRTPSQIRAEAEEYAGYFKDSSGNVLKNRAGNDLTADSLISFAVNAKENMKGTNPDWVKDQKDRTKALFEANGIKYSDDKINEIVRKLC